MHCVITGAADGIGRSLAIRFAKAGYTITGIDIDVDLAQKTQAEIEALGRQSKFILADLSLTTEQNRVVQELRQGMMIDVFIHNAGINAFGPFATSDIEQQKKVIAVNLTAPMQLTAGILRPERLASPSTVVFISSLSHFVSYPGAAVYAGSKDGLASYARSLSVALAKQKVRVLTVYPGPTRTAHARRYSPDNSREHKRMSPDILAEAIYRAVIKRQSSLVPSAANKAFALVGRLFPRLTERLMKKTLLDKLVET